MCDLDHFKRVNDTHGHMVGDEVLRAAVRILLEGIRKTDWVARYGGEEFIIVLPETSLDDAIRSRISCADNWRSRASARGA